MKLGNMRALAIIGVIGVAACGSGRAAQITPAKYSPPTTTGTTIPTPLAHQNYGTVPVAKPPFSIGSSVTRKNGGSALFMVGPPTFDQSFLHGLETPKNGQFVSFKVTMTALTDSFDYNPFGFYVRDTTGQHYDASNWKEPALHSGTLRTGETVSGWVTFDVPSHGALVFTDYGSSSIAEWDF